MHISILLMEQIIQLFLMIFMGFLIVKAKLLNSEDSKILSIIVLYLIIPCVIINAFQVDYTPQTVKGLLIALVGSVMTQVILLIVVSILGRVFHLNEMEVASIYYSNSGNLIVPIVMFILGKEWVLYGCVFMSVQLVFIWTHCKKIISRESVYDWRKIVLNINMNPSKVDVNVHPAKLVVRFEEENKIFQSIYHAIKNTLLKETKVGVIITITIQQKNGVI